MKIERREFKLISITDTNVVKQRQADAERGNDTPVLSTFRREHYVDGKIVLPHELTRVEKEKVEAKDKRRI